MGLEFEIFDARDMISFPDGDNSTDTVFGGVHFNLTTLERWNYTFYSNGTLSNHSKCWLTFPPYQPALLFTNGSFVNATKCYSAIEPVGARGLTGIGLAAAFTLALLLNLTALAKHGKIYLARETRFYPIGRRWQWYWGCFVSACALISLLLNIDVDRYYIQELPIIVTSFFWFLMCQGTVALCWEAVRHWGSWLERQYIDPNPFVYRTDDGRSKLEFWMPLWTYFWIWMNFFMVVPRSWKFVSMQRSPELTEDITIPASQGARFRAAGFFLVVAWLTILYSLRHSIKYYRPRNRGIFNRAVGFLRAIPFRFVLIIPLTAATIAYQIAISFVWDFSVMRFGGNVPIIYGWGYGPPLLILYIQAVYGYFTMNEDKQLINQRRARGEIIDRELGIVRKPAWWKRVRGDHLDSLRDKIMKNVHEVGGTTGTGRRELTAMERHIREENLRSVANGDGIEMNSMPMDRNNPRFDRAGAKSILSPQYLPDYKEGEDLGSTGAHVSHEPPPYADGGEAEAQRPGAYTDRNGRHNSTSTTRSINSPPQQIRSMLDV